MQTADCILILNEFKATVPKNDVTPTEVMFLIHSHSANAGGMPIKSLKVKGTNTLTDKAELDRLKGHYRPFSPDPKALTLEKVFPKGTKLPQTFAEVTDNDGNLVFDAKGAILGSQAVAEPKTEIIQKIKVGDKEYTAEELAKLIPAK